MGANEKGLFIANEAQGSRCGKDGEEGLLGMDMLRLALERCASAREAISCIGGLLSQYGQNANANVRYDRRYENSYMLVDCNEIWVMETAGREWVARRYTDWTAISNCYTIKTDYEMSSPNMETLARERHWISPHEAMNFAKAYTLPAWRQSHSVPRWRRMQTLIRARGGALTLHDVQRIARDHYDGEIVEPRFGACYANFISICMHAQDPDSSQTAASMLFTYDDSLGMVFRYAPSLPCCSVYIPVYWTQNLPDILQKGGRYYDERTLWWNVEKLAMAISVDEERFGPEARAALHKLELEIEAQTLHTEQEAKRLICAGDRNAANRLLDDLTERSAQALLTLAGSLSKTICDKLRADGGLYGQRKEFLEAYCAWAQMTLV